MKQKLTLDTAILAGPREVELKGAKLSEQASASRRRALAARGWRVGWVGGVGRVDLENGLAFSFFVF